MNEELGLSILNGALDERVAQSTSDSQKTWSGKVVRKGNDGTVYVDIFGGERNVPCSIVQVATNVGHTVQVRFQDGRAIIVGDITDPAAPNSSVTKVDNKVKTVVRQVEIVQATKADVEQLTAAEGRIDTLSAGVADIETAMIGKADVDDLTAAEARIGSLEADHVSASDLQTANAQIQQLQADTADIGTIRANSAKVQNLTAAELEADHATVGSLSANYARIDGANITNLTAANGWLDKIMVQTGMLSHSTTTYELDAIQVNASSIKAGTLDVERLIVTQTDAQGNQQKYLVHVDGESAVTYQKMDGNIIQDLTITTDKLVAGAVTADKITTQNISGTGGWINLRNGTFAYLNATTAEGIAWDGQHLTIAGSVTVGSSQMLLEQIAQMAQDAVSNIQFKVTYSVSGSTVTCAAHVYSAGTEVTSNHADSCFVWSMSLNGGTSWTSLGTGKTKAVTAMTAFGGNVKCDFTPAS